MGISLYLGISFLSSPLHPLPPIISDPTKHSSTNTPISLALPTTQTTSATASLAPTPTATSPNNPKAPSPSLCPKNDPKPPPIACVPPFHLPPPSKASSPSPLKLPSVCPTSSTPPCRSLSSLTSKTSSLGAFQPHFSLLPRHLPHPHDYPLLLPLRNALQPPSLRSNPTNPDHHPDHHPTEAHHANPDPPPRQIPRKTHPTPPPRYRP